MIEGLQLQFQPAPPPELRTTLAREINAFHARTVPGEAKRFAFLLNTADATLAAAVMASIAWNWLFVEALFVAEAWRKRGLGADLLDCAEAHALAEGCHSVWLDTFQARDFYLRRGYTQFGSLEDYPPGQTRWFLRKRLRDVPQSDTLHSAT